MACVPVILHFLYGSGISVPESGSLPGEHVEILVMLLSGPAALLVCSHCRHTHGHFPSLPTEIVWPQGTQGLSRTILGQLFLGKKRAFV